MPAFRFRFEIVLRHRTLIEDECQRDMAKVLRHRMILQDQLRLMQETIVDSKRQLGDGLIGRVDLDRVAQFARYSSQVAQRARDIVQKLVTAEKQIEIARQKLLKATRDRKALELLRDRQLLPLAGGAGPARSGGDGRAGGAILCPAAGPRRR